MEDLNIYGHLGSQPVRSVVCFLKLSKIPYNFHQINLAKGDQFTESFEKINPFKAIPALVHGDYSLWESAAMVTYISEVFNTDNQWYPKDLKERARVNSYLHWHHENIRENIAGLVREKFIFPKYFGTPEITPEREADVRSKFEDCLKVIAWMIKDTGYIARTEKASIADIFAYSEIAQNWFIGFTFDECPELKEWAKEIEEIQEVHEVHEVLREIIRNS